MHFEREFLDELMNKVDMFELMKANGIDIESGTGKNAYYVADWCCGKKDRDNGRVDKIKNTYKCMACGEQGNQIHFLRRAIGLSFIDAVKCLCKFAGVSIPKEDPAAKEKESRREKVLSLAAEFYHGHSHDYLINRGISKEVLNRAKAGYAPGGRKLREFLEKEGFTKEELLEFRLINHKGLDSFFYRAIIPIYHGGKVIDLYGRAVDDIKTNVNHFYLYSDPFLNGLDNIDPKRLVTLFETAIDRLAAEANGLDNGVDPGGAHKFTSTQARMLKNKGVKHVAIIYDGDKAGREGALKTGDLLEKEKIRVRVVELPEGTDVAVILQQGGKGELSEHTNSAKPYLTFKAYEELRKHPIDLVEKFLYEQKRLDYPK